MAGPNGHLAGGKYTASHTTVIDAAVAPLEAAARLACVSKISLGIIKRLPAGDPLLKFVEAGPGCLMIKIRGRTTLQEAWIYTSDKELAMVTMRAAFGR